MTSSIVCGIDYSPNARAVAEEEDAAFVRSVAHGAARIAARLDLPRTLAHVSAATTGSQRTVPASPRTSSTRTPSGRASGAART